MRRVGCKVGGASLLVLAIGCGGGSKETLSNDSSWQLYNSASTETFASHIVVGADGDDGNRVSCSNHGTFVDITLRDAGKAIDLDGDGTIDLEARHRSELVLRASLDNRSICEVSVKEVSVNLTPTEDDPVLEDRCGTQGTCTITLMQEDGGRHIEGTLACSALTQTLAGSDDPPRQLADIRPDGPSKPMRFSIDNCQLR